MCIHQAHNDHYWCSLCKEYVQLYKGKKFFGSNPHRRFVCKKCCGTTLGRNPDEQRMFEKNKRKVSVDQLASSPQQTAFHYKSRAELDAAYGKRGH